MADCAGWQPEATAVLRGQPGHAGSYRLGVALLLGVAAIGALIWKRPVAPPPSAVAAKPSVAVLPFQNLSADPQNEYFSDGMTEEIISKLSRIQSLQVASRTSVMRYKGTQKDIKEIGQELGVRYLLEGSVRKAENRVRVTAQLIDTDSGFHVWSDDFDREIKDVFAVQEETAVKIAEALNLKLSPQEQQAVRRRYTENPDAYDAYLRGRAVFGYSDEPQRLEAARVHFEKALKSDPDYAPALAGVSLIESLYYRNRDPSPARLQRADQLAQRALALDPQLMDARLAMGRVYACKYDYVRAEQEFRQAVKLEPENPYAWCNVAWALSYQQPPDAAGAEQAAREAIRLQPGLPLAYYYLGRALLLQQRYPEAAEAFTYTLELSPAYGPPHLGLSQVYLAQGNYDLALAELDKGEVRGGAGTLVQRSAIYAARGEKDKALRDLKEALAAGYRDLPTSTPAPTSPPCATTRATSNLCAATGSRNRGAQLAPAVPREPRHRRKRTVPMAISNFSNQGWMVSCHCSPNFSPSHASIQHQGNEPRNV
jgi:TolB-like protein/Tfp pilus assembly protein PilF